MEPKPSFIASFPRASTLALAGLVVTVAQMDARGQTIVYVDANAVGPTHDGSGWCNAYLELTPALKAASVGTTIRVADGVYHPDPSGLPNPRQATFQLKSGVTVEGGYGGCGAPDPNLRNTDPSTTTLSGDVLGNDPAGNEFRDCCNATYLPGCPDAVCAEAVCAQLSYCCEIQWQQDCAQTAQSKCGTLCQTKADNSYHVVTGSGTDTTAVLDGITITVGQADDPSFQSEDAKGAGMYAQGGSPTVRNCHFRRNDARILGGGLYIHTGSPEVIGCTFEDNRARSFDTEVFAGGGGAYVEAGNPLFTGCSFIANVVDFPGGGILLKLTTGTLEQCRFIGNSGPGIDCAGSSPLIEMCTIMSNGGGVFFGGGTPSVRKCLIMGNYGPGVYSQGGNPEVINSLIVGNFSGGSGGGVWCQGCNGVFRNCTIVANTAYNYGGGLEASGSAEVITVNSIFWANEARLSGQQIYLRPLPSFVPQLTVSYSNVQGGQSAVGGSGTLTWGAGNIDQDPLFVNANGADGIVGNEDDNLRLLPESPCVDAGDNGALPVSVTTDLDGHPRIVDGDGGKGAIVDMGAYEAPKPIPALGEWGVVIMALSMLILGTILIYSQGGKMCHE